MSVSLVPDPTPPLPEYLAAIALTKGVPEDELDTVWVDYADWSAREYPGHDLGGPSWERHCERSAKRYRTLTTEQKTKLEAARERSEEARAQAEARDRAYRKQAVTFEEYAQLLRQRDPTKLNLVERSIVDLMAARADRPFGFHDWFARLPDQHTTTPDGAR
jgi:hypothetical protein